MRINNNNNNNIFILLNIYIYQMLNIKSNNLYIYIVNIVNKLISK